MKNQQPPDGGQGRPAQLHIERYGDDHWTWRYVEAASGVELHSNETFTSREAAADWARRAYPDVPFAEDEDSESAPA